MDVEEHFYSDCVKEVKTVVSQWLIHRRKSDLCLWCQTLWWTGQWSSDSKALYSLITNSVWVDIRPKETFGFHTAEQYCNSLTLEWTVSGRSGADPFVSAEVLSVMWAHVCGKGWTRQKHVGSVGLWGDIKEAQWLQEQRFSTWRRDSLPAAHDSDPL